MEHADRDRFGEFLFAAHCPVYKTQLISSRSQHSVPPNPTQVSMRLLTVKKGVQPCKGGGVCVNGAAHLISELSCQNQPSQ